MEPLLHPRPAQAARAQAPLLHRLDRAGILYAEDFDGPAAPPAGPPPPEPVEPSFSSGEMEAARLAAAEAAVRQARAEWDASDARLRAEAMQAVASGLATAAADGAARADAMAEATVRAILALVAGLLPARCARHGDAEVRALVAHVLPLLQRETAITVRAGPAAAGLVQADLATLDDELGHRVSVTAVPGMASGSVSVAWQDGSLVRDASAVHAAMLAVLAELGLGDPALDASHGAAQDADGGAAHPGEPHRRSEDHAGP